MRKKLRIKNKTACGAVWGWDEEEPNDTKNKGKSWHMVEKPFGNLFPVKCSFDKQSNTRHNPNALYFRVVFFALNHTISHSHLRLYYCTPPSKNRNADSHHASVFTTVLLMLSHIARFSHLHLVFSHKLPCYMQHDYKWAVYSVCWRTKSAEDCGQRATHPSTARETWRIVALPSRPLPRRLSCYTARADLTPWRDNSPFFQLCHYNPRWLSLHHATGPSPRAGSGLPLEPTKRKMSILCSFPDS